MDLGTLTVTIILIVICTLPFALMGIKNSKKRKNNNLKLSNIAKINDSLIEQCEFWNDSVIALDGVNQKLFFSNQASDGDSYKIIPLSEVFECNWVKTDNNNNGIRKLELQLVFDGGNRHVMLEFYNEYRNVALINEFELIRKWSGMINANIKK